MFVSFNCLTALADGRRRRRVHSWARHQRHRWGAGPRLGDDPLRGHDRSGSAPLAPGLMTAGALNGLIDRLGPSASPVSRRGVAAAAGGGAATTGSAGAGGVYVRRPGCSRSIGVGCMIDNEFAL